MKLHPGLYAAWFRIYFASHLNHIRMMAKNLIRVSDVSECRSCAVQPLNACSKAPIVLAGRTFGQYALKGSPVHIQTACGL